MNLTNMGSRYCYAIIMDKLRCNAAIEACSEIAFGAHAVVIESGSEHRVVATFLTAIMGGNLARRIS